MRSGLMSASTMMEMGFDDDMEMDVDVDVAAVLRKVGGRAAKERAGWAVEARRRMAAADLAIMSRGEAGLWGGRSAQSRPGACRPRNPRKDRFAVLRVFHNIPDGAGHILRASTLGTMHRVVYIHTYIHTS